MPESPGLPLPEPVPVSETLYVLFPDGTLGRITARGSDPPVLTGGARLVPQEEYEERRDRMREQHEARVAEMLAIEEQRCRGQ